MHNMQDYDLDKNMDDDDVGDCDVNDHYIMKNGEVREQDRYLPIANIARIMKTVLPGNAKIAKDAKESIQECVSEFISFITSEASDKCQQEKRKTINGDDLLWAMSTLGFDKYIEPLKLYLAKYRESVKGEKPEKKPASSNKKNSGDSGPSHHSQPKNSSHPHHHAVSHSAGGVGNSIPSNGGLGMMSLSGGGGSVGLSNLQQMGPGILPSMSDLAAFNHYDSNSSGGGALLMGNLEDSPLFLGQSGGSNTTGGGTLLGGESATGGSSTILPPLPKKRKEHPPLTLGDMQFGTADISQPNKHT